MHESAVFGVRFSINGCYPTDLRTASVAMVLQTRLIIMPMIASPAQSVLYPILSGITRPAGSFAWSFAAFNELGSAVRAIKRTRELSLCIFSFESILNTRLLELIKVKSI